ncbi:parathyroid hormone 4-like [Protopterus annectens]|uniref:parathyroid hormone 4-like n=1 Tax=Protopterus annectens TaxID=7888 RepID=UPI001CF982FF|nr:parathyroid hormone 4-like [Protopterus annectens]
MLLTEKSLVLLSFLGLILISCIATCQETESKRAVTEHQFMHDKGRTIQGLKRLMWLHSAMGGLHTASGRDLSHTLSEWDLQNIRGMLKQHSDANWEESLDLLKQKLVQLIMEEQATPLLKQSDLLLFLKNASNRWNQRDITDSIQDKEKENQNFISTEAN